MLPKPQLDTSKLDKSGDAESSSLVDVAKQRAKQELENQQRRDRVDEKKRRDKERKRKLKQRDRRDTEDDHAA